jgi:RNA polymerase sigma-70 factor, ECF subfamily
VVTAKRPTRKLAEHLSAEGRFQALYDRNVEALRRYVWRRAPMVVDDVVAEAFLVAWRRLDEVPADALPWLIAVARNVLLNEHRRARRQTALSDRIAAEPERTAAGSEGGVSDVVQAALAALPKHDREILLLAAWEDLDRQAIAQALGCSKPSVSVRLHRARRRFISELERLNPEDQSQLRPAIFPGGFDA